MATRGEVELTIDEGVAVLTLAAPAQRNAFTPEMAAEFEALCDRIDADLRVACTVVRGAGGYFCAGAHRAVLAAAAADPASDDAFRDLEALYRAFLRFGEMRTPTVAAVRGGAIGAGVNLALSADLRVVGENARLASGFLAQGIHPGGGHFSLLGRMVGRDGASAMGLFGLSVTGRRAAELGLAWEAVPDARVEQRALEIARAVGADPQLARRAVRSMRMELGPPGLSWDAAVEAEHAPQMWSLRRRADRAAGDAAMNRGDAGPVIETASGARCSAPTGILFADPTWDAAFGSWTGSLGLCCD